MKIEIENFGRHEILVLDDHTSGEVMFVVGKNRVGKSTVRDAIEFALLGSCQIRGFRTKKEVATYMIREGASSARVTVRLGPWSVRRSVSRGGSSKIEVSSLGSDDRFVEVNATQWNEHFGIEADAVRVALDADHFYRMEEKDRRKLLISVKDSEGVSMDDVWTALGTAITDFAKEDSGREGALRGICDHAATLGFAGADAKAVERRRDAKRDLQSAHNQIEALAPIVDQIDGVDITVGEVADHEAKLATIAESVRTLRDHRAAVGGKTSGLIAGAVIERARAESELVRLQGKAVGVTHDGDLKTYKVPELDKLSRIAKGEMDAAVSITAGVREESREAAEAMAAAEARRDTIEALKKSPEDCPAVNFAMPCPVKPERFQKAYLGTGGKDDDLFNADGAVLEAQEAKNEQWEKSQAHDAEVSRCEGVFELWTTSLDEAKAQAKAVEDAKGRLAEIQVRIEVMEAEAEALGEGPTDDDIEAAETRLAIGTRIVEARRTLDARRTVEERLYEEADALKVEVLWWDEVEKLFRPDGIEASLASMATSRFAESLESCDDLAKVRIDDAMTLTINAEHISTRSRSEQLCGGIALQSAMALQIGLPILVIDEVDKLDAGWKRTFQAWAADSSKRFSAGVLVLATSDANPPAVPPDGFQTAWVRVGEPTLTLGGEFE